MKAIPRNSAPAEPTYAPLIRSGALFSEHDPDFQAQYFDTIASAPAGAVLPEHVFGVNGWQRRLASSGADPAVARAVFDETWNSMPFDQRRATVLGNAVARCYSPGIAETVSDAVTNAKRDAGSVIARNPDVGYLSLGNPVAATEEFQRKLFGDFAAPSPDIAASLGLEQEGEA